ncbi:uncharacterized protein LOC130692028 [Daphnia carinata]|uniref:uncharacterized protein LOC130692028 n=1 Tax=Daphnia carinata TaxID=120202 RepID=UPI00257A9EC3|nr:uncharacterized protein LOC130692028 [Daphnia carinata]
MKRQYNDTKVCLKDMQVSLTMELSYPLESESNVFYESGLSKVMKRTNTVIYCPSNEKDSVAGIQKVEIVGSLAAVESARLLIRDYVPIGFVTSCRSDRVDSLGTHLLVAHFSSTFGVKMVFKLVEEDSSYQVNIRGHQYRFALLREAVYHFCHIVQTPSESVEMDLGSSSLHVSLVRNCTQLIEKKSGARICCPADGNSVLVRGSLETAYFASEIIAGVTPLHLKFQGPSSVEMNERIRSISRQMDISVSIDKTDSGIDELNFSTCEWNTRYLYELWRLRLGLQLSFSILPTQRYLWSDLAELPNSFFRKVNSTIFGPQREELALEGHRTSCDEILNLRRI